ncbi:htxA [Symbiodinium sp. KB8]|nr:htxA [Symbiodinium sp. KB8]
MDLRPGSMAGAAEMEDSERSEFWERGYLSFKALLAKEAPAIRARMDLMMKDAPVTTADWNAVDAGGAAFVLAVNEHGKTVSGRILKVQSAALASSAVLEVFRSPEVVAKVRELYSFLGPEVPEHVDVFGTKFFPMWPGGVSVDWHQDCHYFGTASERIISCGVYLEDTDEENGCLQVVPGSHAFDFEHKPGSGLHAQGEWVTPDASSVVVDVMVPAGSVVLFNSRLLHAARQNNHATRTRYSLFGHFVPSDLDFSWRGTDFSHGKYRDRHQIY